MATIPMYSGPRVREAPLQGGELAQVDVSGNARALAGGLNAAADVADRLALRDDQTAAFNAQTQITSAWLEWDTQARQQYRGQNVDGYSTAAQTWWKTAAETYGKDLNPRARSLASRTLAERQARALDAVGVFTATEKERHFDETAAATITSTIQFGVTNDDTAGAAGQVRALVAGMGARKGWETAQVQAEQLRHLGALHLAQITKLSIEDPAKARAYYELNKAEVGAANQPRVEEVIGKEEDNQFAQQFAAKHAGLPLADQLAKAGEVTDPERRKKALTAVRENHTLVKAAQQEQESTAADEAWQLVGQGKRVPEAVLVRMDGRSRVQLQEHLADRARIAADRAEAKSHAAVRTDWDAYIDLREKLAAGEKVDLRPYAGTKIAPAQMEQLLDIQTKAPAKAVERDVATSQQQLATYTDQLKLPRDKKGALQSAAQAEFDAFKDAHGGRVPNFDERRKILDGLVLERENEWYQFGTERAYEMPAAERAGAKFKAPPEAARPQKYTPGQVYRDAKGNRAIYQADGSWKPTQ